MTRCPLCRARLSGAATCPRCGADLGLAQAAERAAAHHLERALTCLAANDQPRAAAHAERALRLHRSPLAKTIADWAHTPSPARATHSGNPTEPGFAQKP